LHSSFETQNKQGNPLPTSTIKLMIFSLTDSSIYKLRIYFSNSPTILTHLPLPYSVFPNLT
jgi:hypothetical protein